MIIGFYERETKVVLKPESSEEEFVVAYILAVFRNGGRMKIKARGVSKGMAANVRKMIGPKTRMVKKIDKYISCLDE